MVGCAIHLPTKTLKLSVNGGQTSCPPYAFKYATIKGSLKTICLFSAPLNIPPPNLRYNPRANRHILTTTQGASHEIRLRNPKQPLSQQRYRLHPPRTPTSRANRLAAPRRANPRRTIPTSLRPLQPKAQPARKTPIPNGNLQHQPHPVLPPIRATHRRNDAHRVRPRYRTKH